MLERKLRTLLLVFSVAVAFFIFGVLAGILANFDSSASGAAGDELMVTNKVGVLQPLPLRYRTRIAAVEGVARVGQVNIFAAHYREEKNRVPAFMVEAQPFLAGLGDEMILDAGQRERFLAQKSAVIVDDFTARQWSWKAGDGITLSSGLYMHKDGGRDWRFLIAGIYRSANDANPLRGVVGHFAYLNDSVAFGGDQVHWFTVHAADPRIAGRVGRAIDAEFANSPAETKTQPAAGFARAFLSQLGDLNLIVTLVAGAGFVMILFIVGNTIAVSVRQRRKQFATLMVLGFGPRHIFALIIGEAMLLSAVGGLIGLAAASAFVSAARVGLGAGIGAVGLPASTWLMGAGLIVLLGLATGALPAWGAIRLKPIVALARS